MQSLPFSGADLERSYADLRRYAQSLLDGERTSHTLQATALVNEAVVKLLTEFEGRSLALPDESHPKERRRALFAMISLRMRQVLVEYARQRNAAKRSGGWTRSPLHDALEAAGRQRVDVIALDEALATLQRSDPQAAAVFQHRWFCGLSMRHVAEVLELPAADVQIVWNRARRALQSILKESDADVRGRPEDPDA